MGTAAIARSRPRDMEWFINELKAVSPGNLRALWFPHPLDATTNRLSPDRRVWTASATVQGRITYQGNGVMVTFTPASSHVISTPDTANLSVGNGTVDGPLTLAVFANITNTAVARTLISKEPAAATNYEYRLDVTADGDPVGDDRLRMLLYDTSAGAAPLRVSDVAVTMGVPTLFGMTYSAATGGATAANDITLYENGVEKASTATNAGTYVAMEDTTGLGFIGGDGTVQGFMAGNVGFGAMWAAALTAAQHRAIANICREYYKVRLAA